VTPSITVVTSPAADGDAPPRTAHQGSDARVAANPVNPSIASTTSFRIAGRRHKGESAVELTTLPTR
jgi:hypothetical protein